MSDKKKKKSVEPFSGFSILIDPSGGPGTGKPFIKVNSFEGVNSCRENPKSNHNSEKISASCGRINDWLARRGGETTCDSEDGRIKDHLEYIAGIGKEIFNLIEVDNAKEKDSLEG